MQAHTHTGNRSWGHIPIRSVLHWLEHVYKIARMDPELLQRWEVVWTVVTLNGSPVLYEDRDWVVTTSGQTRTPYLQLRLWKQGKRHGRAIMLRVLREDEMYVIKALGLLGIGWQDAGCSAKWLPSWSLAVFDKRFE